MEQGDYATAYRIAPDSEKNIILAECLIIKCLDDFSDYLYHPSSLEIIDCQYTVTEESDGIGDFIEMKGAIKYSALNKAGTGNGTSWEKLVVKYRFTSGSCWCYQNDDDEGTYYRNFEYDSIVNKSLNSEKMSRKQLDRVNKRAADRTLGEVTTIPIDSIDRSVLLLWTWKN